MKSGLALFVICLISLWGYDVADGQTSGALRWYIADLKPSFPENEFWSTKTALTDSNYRIVVDGLIRNVRVNAIRLPIFPDIPNPSAYPSLYKEVFIYARQIGLRIYASPQSVGTSSYPGWSEQQYAQWLAAYINTYQPDFVSPFNESGMPASKMVAIVADLRPLLRVKTSLVGPDKEHVEGTLKDLEDNSQLLNSFDIISSHNAGQDVSAIHDNWARLVSLAGSTKPVWSSENPRPWDQDKGLPGIDEAVGAGVQGLVIWMGKPHLIDDEGIPSPKAHSISAHLWPQN